MSDGGAESLRQAFEKIRERRALDEQETVEEALEVLSFALAEEWYGFPLASLVEIIGGADPTPIPFTPDYIAGVINHRGRVVAVVDLRRVFGLEPPATRLSRRRVVLVSSEDIVVGFEADAISDVLAVERSAIEPPLSTIERVKAEYIAGCVRRPQGLLVLLDVRTLLHELGAESGPVE